MAAIRLILAIPLAIIAIAWTFGAVWFDAPFGAGNHLAAVLLAITFVVVLLLVEPEAEPGDYAMHAPTSWWSPAGVVLVLPEHDMRVCGASRPGGPPWAWETPADAGLG